MFTWGVCQSAVRWFALLAVCTAYGVIAAEVPATPLSMTIESFVARGSQAAGNPVVRLRGTVTAFIGEDAFFLQDATAATLVFKIGAPKDVRLGDLVDVYGIPGVGGVTPHVLSRGLVVVEHGPVPTPLVLDGADAPGTGSDGMLVRFRGRVANDSPIIARGQQVRLAAWGRSIALVAPSEGDQTDWPKLGPADLVEVTGVLSFQAQPGSSFSTRRVILRRRGDLTLIQPAPWWRQNQPLVWGSLLAFSAAGATGLGVFILRRRNRHKAVAALPPPIAPQPRPSSTSLPRSTPFPASVPTMPPPEPVETDMERRYRELFESATDIILTHDLDGQITSFNPAGERLLGWPAAEVMGRPIYTIMAPDEAEIAGGLVQAGRAPEGSGGGSFHLDLKTRDGRVVPFEVNSWIEYQEGEPVGVQAICRDITHRLRSEDERQRFERRLVETQKLESLGILAGGIAHDFNNLLTAVLGNASLARIELPPDSPTQKSMEEIELAAERAADLCSQMLAYSGQGRFVVTRLNLSSLVFETMELIQASVSKRAKLNIDLAEKLPMIHGDAMQLRQVLMNLIINASESLGEGHGTVNVRTSVMTASSGWAVDAQHIPESFEGDYVVLEVTDTGSGMNPETAARMFEPFFTTKFTGRGLGLAAVLGIVRSHRGALKVETQLGQGTSLWIALPAVGVLYLGGHPTAETESRPLFHATVLVVDDEAPVRRTMTRALEMMGCKVVVAEDGSVALERVRQYGRPFDLVLLDLTMPQMDGVQTLRELRRMRPELPVILMSGFAQTQAIARFGEHRMSGFLQKPFKLDELTRLVTRVLQEQPAAAAKVH